MNSENRIERIAKSIEAGSPYYSLINYLINETGDKFDLKIDIGRKLSGSTYVVHHIHGKEYGHEIHQKMSSAKKNEIIQSLEAGETTYLGEINDIVIIPKWFHDYIESHGLASQYRNKEDFRRGIYQIFLDDTKREEVKRLRFEGRSILEKLKTIQAIYMTIPPLYRPDINKQLNSIHEELLAVIERIDIKEI